MTRHLLTGAVVALLGVVCSSGALALGLRRRERRNARRRALDTVNNHRGASR